MVVFNGNTVILLLGDEHAPELINSYDFASVRLVVS